MRMSTLINLLGFSINQEDDNSPTSLDWARVEDRIGSLGFPVFYRTFLEQKWKKSSLWVKEKNKSNSPISKMLISLSEVDHKCFDEIWSTMEPSLQPPCLLGHLIITAALFWSKQKLSYFSYLKNPYNTGTLLIWSPSHPNNLAILTGFHCIWKFDCKGN